MTHHARQEYSAALCARYRAATKQEKGRILDEYCQTAACHRKAAIRRLRPAAPAGRRGPAAGAPRAMAPTSCPPWSASGSSAVASAASSSPRSCPCSWPPWSGTAPWCRPRLSPKGGPMGNLPS